MRHDSLIPTATCPLKSTRSINLDPEFSTRRSPKTFGSLCPGYYYRKPETLNQTPKQQNERRIPKCHYSTKSPYLSLNISASRSHITALHRWSFFWLRQWVFWWWRRFKFAKKATLQLRQSLLCLWYGPRNRPSSAGALRCKPDCELNCRGRVRPVVVWRVGLARGGSVVFERSSAPKVWCVLLFVKYCVPNSGTWLLWRSDKPLLGTLGLLCDSVCLEQACRRL